MRWPWRRHATGSGGSAAAEAEANAQLDTAQSQARRVVEVTWAAQHLARQAQLFAHDVEAALRAARRR